MLSDFHQPVFIIQGDQDVVTDDMAITADSVFPNSRLVFLENCGHYGWLDQEQRYFGEIEDFLRGIER